jgi:hypothetical protein
LALAAVIAQHSPSVRAFDKRVIARLFRGNTSFGFTPNTKISVDADSVVCRVSNVNITARSCELSFGSRKRTLTGREANELGATAAAAGVPSEGAARLKHRNHLQVTVHDRSERDYAEGGRRRGLQFRNGAVAVFVHLKRNPLAANLRSLTKERAQCLAARIIGRDRGASSY